MKKFMYISEKFFSQYSRLHHKLLQQMRFLRKVYHIEPEDEVIGIFFAFFFLLFNVIAYVAIKIMVREGAMDIQSFPAFVSLLIFQITYEALDLTSDISTSDSASFLYSIVISVIMYYFLTIYPILASVIGLIIYGIIIIGIILFQFWAILGLIIYPAIMTVLILFKF